MPEFKIFALSGIRLSFLEILLTIINPFLFSRVLSSESNLSEAIFIFNE
jgi:hypothetical protein